MYIFPHGTLAHPPTPHPPWFRPKTNSFQQAAVDTVDATIHQGNWVRIELFPSNWISIDRSVEAADVQKHSGEAVRCNLCSFTPLLFESIWPERADIWLSCFEKGKSVRVGIGRLYLTKWFIWAKGNTVHKLCFAKRFKEHNFRGRSESLTLRIFVSLGSDGQF